MNNLIKIGDSRVYYRSNPDIHIGEYYNYCLKIFLKALDNISTSVNLILGDLHFDFNNSNKTFKIDIQPEHTLVKEGGRSVEEKIKGGVPTDDNGNYLIRIPNFNYFSSLDATIEYSIPNLINIGTSDRQDLVEYLKTAIYIAPLIYDDFYFSKEGRSDIITMFTSNSSARRSSFSNRSGVKNIQGSFCRESLRKDYHTVKILVNIHQTDHHHSFEELRVLPALCNGVIVVSEDVPLKDKIPYNKQIVWSTYDLLEDTVRDVQNNYEEYHSKIFNKELKTILEEMSINNHNSVLKFLEIK